MQGSKIRHLSYEGLQLFSDASDAKSDIPNTSSSPLNQYHVQ